MIFRHALGKGRFFQRSGRTASRDRHRLDSECAGASCLRFVYNFKSSTRVIRPTTKFSYLLFNGNTYIPLNMNSSVEVIDIDCSSDEEGSANRAENDSKEKSEADTKPADSSLRRREKIDEILDICLLSHNRAVALENLMDPAQRQRWSNHLASILPSPDNPTFQPSFDRPHFNSYGNTHHRENSNYSTPEPRPRQPSRARPRRRTTNRVSRRAKRRSTTAKSPKGPVSQMARCKAAAKQIMRARSTKAPSSSNRSESRPTTSRVKTEPRAPAPKVKSEPRIKSER